MFKLLNDTSAPTRRSFKFLFATVLIYTSVLVAVIASSIVLIQPSMAETLDLVTMVTPPPMSSHANPPVKSAHQDQRVPDVYAVPNDTDIPEQTPVSHNISSVGPVDLTSKGPSGPPCPECLDSGTGVGVLGGTGPGPAAPTPPGPEPAPAPVKKVTPPDNKPIRLASSIIQGKAIDLPKPDYPRLAVSIHQEGTVQVDVVIDKTGHVVSAVAVSGPPILREAATSAARRAVFQPTILSGEPVSVEGVLLFKFTLE